MSSSQDSQPPEQSIEQPSAKLEPDNNVEKDKNPIIFSINDIDIIHLHCGDLIHSYDGSWTSLDDIESLIIPTDLKEALELNQVAKQNFQGFSNSSKKNILAWICNAKRAETRLRKIEQTISSLTQNRSPL